MCVGLLDKSTSIGLNLPVSPDGHRAAPIGIIFFVPDFFISPDPKFIPQVGCGYCNGFRKSILVWNVNFLSVA